MRNILRTVIAGFVPGVRPVNVHAIGYQGENPLPGETYRVVSRFEDVSNPSVSVLVPMAPVEARAYAAWLIAEADYADHRNNGVPEDVEPRVGLPEDWSDEL
jgi:hypothetical protein